MSIKNIETTKIDYDLAIECAPIDQLDLFGFISTDMCAPLRELVLEVKPAQEAGNFLIVCQGTRYTREGYLFEGAKKVGWSNIPCKIVTEASPEASAPPTTSTMSSNWPVHTADIDVMLAVVAILLMPTVKRAAVRYGRTVQRRIDCDDLLQLVMLVLWFRIRRNGLRLKDGDAIRAFVYVVCRNLLRRTIRDTAREQSLIEDPPRLEPDILDRLVIEEERQSLEEVCAEVQAIFKDVNDDLDRVLEGMPAERDRAAKLWLDGATYKRVVTKSGLSLARVRRIEMNLKTGALAPKLRRARSALEALAKRSPLSACSIELGRVERLIADPLEE